MSEEDFINDELRQSAVIRQLEIIGEAVKNLPDSFRKEHSHVAWRDIAGFRDILTHEYFGIILEKVWNVINCDLPELKKNIKKILKEL